MNERIKELRGQALRWSGENVNRNLYSNYEIEQKEYDKFAELIVKECNNLNKQVITQCNLEHYLIFDRIVNKYQEHFGVEE